MLSERTTSETRCREAPHQDEGNQLCQELCSGWGVTSLHLWGGVFRIWGVTYFLMNHVESELVHRRLVNEN